MANRTKTKRPYHHGDLRNALIDAAATIVEMRGLHELSLRAAARRAGVSQTAPYRHFEDKEALIAAVAADGFLILAEDLEEALRDAPKLKRAPQIALGRAYLRFAREHPARFHLMFGYDIADPNRYDVIRDAREQLFGVIGRGRKEDDALALWGLAHGVAALSLAQAIDFPEEDFEAEERAQEILQPLLTKT
jgi:AcrR family transcriptional regulator